MRHNKTIASVLLIALALLIGGAYFLYNQLGDRVDIGGQFAQEAVPPPTDNAGQTEADGGEDTAPSAPEQDAKTEPPTEEAAKETVTPPEQTVPEEEEETEGSDTLPEQDEQAVPEEESEEPAAPPDFTVYDGEGNPVTLSKMWEKPVVLNFWGEFCLPCKAEMPHFQTIYDRYGDQVNILMINSVESAVGETERARAYIEKTGYTFPVYYDTDYMAAWMYGVRSYPSTFFMSPNGEEIYYHTGGMTEEMLEIGLELIGVILEEE